jgi:hypothetical protein
VGAERWSRHVNQAHVLIASETEISQVADHVCRPSKTIKHHYRHHLSRTTTRLPVRIQNVRYYFRSLSRTAFFRVQSRTINSLLCSRWGALKTKRRRMETIQIVAKNSVSIVTLNIIAADDGWARERDEILGFEERMVFRTENARRLFNVRKTRVRPVQDREERRATSPR